MNTDPTDSPVKVAGAAALKPTDLFTDFASECVNKQPKLYFFLCSGVLTLCQLSFCLSGSLLYDRALAR